MTHLPRYLLYVHAVVDTRQCTYSIVDTLSSRWLCKGIVSTAHRFMREIHGHDTSTSTPLQDDVDALEAVFNPQKQGYPLLPPEAAPGPIYNFVRIDACNVSEVNGALNKAYGKEAVQDVVGAISILTGNYEEFEEEDTADPRHWTIAFQLFRLRAWVLTGSEPWPDSIKNTTTGKVFSASTRGRMLKLDHVLDNVNDGAEAILFELLKTPRMINVDLPDAVLLTFPADRYAVFRCCVGPHASALLIKELRNAADRATRDDNLCELITNDLARFILKFKTTKKLLTVPFIHILLTFCARLCPGVSEDDQVHVVDSDTFLVPKNSPLSSWFDCQTEAFQRIEKGLRSYPNAKNEECLVLCRLGDVIRNVDAGWLIGCESYERVRIKAERSDVPMVWCLKFIGNLVQGDRMHDVHELFDDFQRGNLTDISQGMADVSIHEYLYKLYEAVMGHRPLPTSEVSAITGLQADTRPWVDKLVDCMNVKTGMVLCRRDHKTNVTKGLYCVPVLFETVYVHRVAQEDIEIGLLEQFRAWLAGGS